MKNIKKFQDYKRNEAVLPEIEEIEVKNPKIDVDNPIDIEGVSLGNEDTQLKAELELEAKHQESIAMKKGLRQKGIPDNHIS